MSFNDIINQSTAKKILLNQLEKKKVPHAYLFLGQPGIGKKKTAFELAKALNCREFDISRGACDRCLPCEKINKNIHPDVRMIDFAFQAALNDEEIEKQKSIKIHTVRAMQHEVNLKPVESSWKIFIIEPAEEITADAAHSLLKTLEEPPNWTLIVLLARHKETLPATIISRCQIIRFSPLKDEEVSQYLIKNLSAETASALSAAKQAEGSIEKAIQIIERSRNTRHSLWNLFKENRNAKYRLLELSELLAKNPAESVDLLRGELIIEMRKDPKVYAPLVQVVVTAQNLIDRNVNPKMVFDEVVLKLQELTVNRQI